MNTFLQISFCISEAELIKFAFGGNSINSTMRKVALIIICSFLSREVAGIVRGQSKQQPRHQLVESTRIFRKTLVLQLLQYDQSEEGPGGGKGITLPKLPKDTASPIGPSQVVINPLPGSGKGGEPKQDGSTSNPVDVLTIKKAKGKSKNTIKPKRRPSKKKPKSFMTKSKLVKSKQSVETTMPSLSPGKPYL